MALMADRAERILKLPILVIAIRGNKFCNQDLRAFTSQLNSTSVGTEGRITVLLNRKKYVGAENNVRG